MKIHAAICRAALARLNECRAKCPGIGGDIDASNLQWMIGKGEFHDSTMAQAAKTLEHLSTVLGIDAAGEVHLLRNAYPLSNSQSPVLSVLNRALGFVEGFEDDETQAPFVPALLRDLRSAIAVHTVKTPAELATPSGGALR